MTLTLNRKKWAFIFMFLIKLSIVTGLLIITHFVSVLNRPLLQETVFQKSLGPNQTLVCRIVYFLLSLCLLGPYVFLSYLCSRSARFFCPEMTFVLEDSRKWQLLQHFKRAHHYHTREPFFGFVLFFSFPTCPSHSNE